MAMEKEKVVCQYPCMSMYDLYVTEIIQARSPVRLK